MGFHLIESYQRTPIQGRIQEFGCGGYLVFCSHFFICLSIPRGLMHAVKLEKKMTLAYSYVPL